MIRWELKGFVSSSCPRERKGGLIPQFRIDFRCCILKSVHLKSALVSSLISLTDNTVQVALDDYFALGDIESLRDHLFQFRNNIPGSFACWSTESVVRLEIRYEASSSDIVIKGGLPSPKWHWDVFAARDPLYFRKNFKLAVEFEFAMRLDRITLPLSQLDAYLEYGRKLRRLCDNGHDREESEPK